MKWNESGKSEIRKIERVPGQLAILACKTIFCPTPAVKEFWLVGGGGHRFLRPVFPMVGRENRVHRVSGLRVNNLRVLWPPCQLMLCLSVDWFPGLMASRDLNDLSTHFRVHLCIRRLLLFEAVGGCREKGGGGRESWRSALWLLRSKSQFYPD